MVDRTFASGEERKLRQQAGTPRHIFDVLHREYRFTVDICASHWNHKLDRYVTEEEDALSVTWEGERPFCNPVYDYIPPWLAKHAEPILVCYLLPVRADRLWWKEYKPLTECHYFVGEKPHKRLQFDAPPGIVYSQNTGANCLFLFGEGCTPGLEVWRSGLTGERL